MGIPEGFNGFRGFTLGLMEHWLKVPGTDERFPASGKRLCDFWLRAEWRELHNGFPEFQVVSISRIAYSKFIYCVILLHYMKLSHYLCPNLKPVDAYYLI